uniref:EF-hand domain-containing protein n=1 Tax=Ciona savignyi TaxID=51511 RepID=H2Z2G4_CIOSA
MASSKMINWIVFLQDFSQIKDVKLKEWGDFVGKLAPPQTPQELPLEDVEDRISEVIAARHFGMSRDFADVDYAKIFVVSKEDFREILNRHVMRLTDSQFDRLWAKQAVNEFNNIEYREFLKKYQLNKEEKSKQDVTETSQSQPVPEETIQPPTNPTRPPSRLGTSDSSRLRGIPRPATPLVNADSAESKIKNLVYKHWQDIQKECKKMDADGSGTVLPDEFIGILDGLGVILPLEDARQLMLKYDLHEQQGRFSYREFLRHFILTLKPQDEGLLRRRKIHAAKIPVDTGVENTRFYNAMISLRERVLLSWKEMRRSFRLADPKALGVVSPSVFRQILRQFSINLTEEDFYHLVSFYDHKMKGKIPYNDFIRAFLQ